MTKKKITKKPAYKWHTVGRSKNLTKAKQIKKSYSKKAGFPGTKIVNQKSGYAVKIKAPKGHRIYLK